MIGDNKFGQRNMPQLNFKIKIVVFYSSKEDKDMLNKLRNECNTCTCQYTVVPIYIELIETTITEAIIKKHIKTRVSGYKKDLDKICIINPYIMKCQHITFNSFNNFKLWFQKDLKINI